MKRLAMFCGFALVAAAVFGIAMGSGFDLFALAHAHPLSATISAVAFGAGVTDGELKGAFDKIGEAFDAFKKSNDEQIAEIKKGVKDPLLEDRIDKIQKSLDAGVEAKAKLDAIVAAEKKEREELEAKLNRLGLGANSESEAKALINLKTFNMTLAGAAADRKKSFAPLEMKGYEDYRTAHEHYLREGKESLSADEVKTLSVGSDPDGGYFVTPDTSGRMVKKVYETSPVRQYASVQLIGTEALEGIEDNGEAGAGYAGEQSTSGDTTTPQVGKWRIPVWNIDTEPKATSNLLDDANVDVEAWLGDKVGNKFGRFENAEFVTGNAAKILGFLAGYTFAADSGSGVTWGQIGYVGTGVNGDFAASNPGDKIIDLMGLLKNDYLSNAAWFTRRSVIMKIRKFKDGQGNYMWQPSFVAGQPETIMGYPVARMEDVPTLATGSISLAFGDLRQAYQIVDRQGIRVLRDPYTAKPFVKFYTTKRVGGGVVNFEALKVMKFS